MEQFRADKFVWITRVLESMIQRYAADPTAYMSPTEKRDDAGKFRHLERDCSSIGLRLSAIYAKDEAEQLESDRDISHKHVADHCRIILGRICDEMSLALFMYVPSERAAYYNQPELLGKNVTDKWPEMQFDIVEAGNCYATGRSTAVVFHLMRIMETGVQEFGTCLGVALANEKNWQNILDEIHKTLKTLPPKDAHTIQLSEVSANLYAVKLAWRNEVMHPKGTYTLEEADNLIRQVRIFMQNLTGVL